MRFSYHFLSASRRQSLCQTNHYQIEQSSLILALLHNFDGQRSSYLISKGQMITPESMYQPRLAMMRLQEEDLR